MKLVNAWREWIFPELTRITTRDSMTQVELRILCSWRSYLLFLPTLAVLLLVTTALLNPFLIGLRNHAISLGYPQSLWISLISALAVVHVLLIFILSQVVTRLLLRKESWKELNKVGFPTCIHCGYDLRGCAKLRCPECGTPPVDVTSMPSRVTRLRIAVLISAALVAIVCGAIAGTMIGARLVGFFG